MAIDFKPSSTGVNFSPSSSPQQPDELALKQKAFNQMQGASPYLRMGAVGMDIGKSVVKQVGQAALGIAQAGTWAGSKLGIPGAETATQTLGNAYDKMDDIDELKATTLPQWFSDLAGFGITFAIPSAGIVKGAEAVKTAVGVGKLGKAAKIGTVMAGEGALMGLTSKNEDRALMAGVGAVAGGLAEGMAPAAGFIAKKAEQASDALFNNTFLSKVSSGVKDSILRLTKMAPDDFTKIGKTGEMISDDFVPSESVVKRVRGYMDLVGLEKGTEKEMGKSVQSILDTNSKALDDYIYKSPAGDIKSPWTDLKQKYYTEKAQYIMENPGNDIANSKSFDAIWTGVKNRMDAIVGNPAQATIKDSQAMKKWYQDVYEKLSPTDPDFNAKEKASKFISDYMRDSVDTYSKGATREWNKKLQVGMLFKQIMNEQTKKSIGSAVPTILARLSGGLLIGEGIGHLGLGALAGIAFSADALARNKTFQAYAIDSLDKTASLFKSLAGKTDTEAISNAILGFVKDSPEKAAIVNTVIKNAPEKTISGFEAYTKKALENFKKNPTKIIDDINKEIDEVAKKSKKILSSQKQIQPKEEAKSLKTTHNVGVSEPTIPQNIPKSQVKTEPSYGGMYEDIKQAEPTALPKVEKIPSAFGNEKIMPERYTEDVSGASEQFKQSSKVKQERIKTSKAFTNPQATAKGQAMKDATVLRHLRGEPTAKEIIDTVKYLNSNYIGKSVKFEGKPATVKGTAFGRIKIQLGDGTVKNVEYSLIESPKAYNKEAIEYLKQEAIKKSKQ
jgi:hypothetical protein